VFLEREVVMLTLMLAAASFGAEPVSYTPAPSLVSYAPVAVETPHKPAAKAASSVPIRVDVKSDRGLHMHQCANGHRWIHDATSFGKVADHTCPVCGLQDWTPRPLPAAPFTTVPPPAVPFATSSCPNGNCPSATPSYIRPRFRLFD
jgi:hypothetical protein